MRMIGILYFKTLKILGMSNKTAFQDRVDNDSDVPSGSEQAEATPLDGNPTAQILELENIDTFWETLTSKKKKGSNSNGRKKQSNSRGKRKLKTVDTTSKVTKKERKSKNQPQPKPAKYAGPSNTDIGSLLTGDLIQDARANRYLPALPAMTSTRKDKALKELVSSLPPEVQEIAKVDKKAFINATKDFRRGFLKIAEDGGRLSGLNCTLRPHQILGTTPLTLGNL